MNQKAEEADNFDGRGNRAVFFQQVYERAHVEEQKKDGYNKSPSPYAGIRVPVFYAHESEVQKPIKFFQLFNDFHILLKKSMNGVR